MFTENTVTPPFLPMNNISPVWTTTNREDYQNCSAMYRSTQPGHPFVGRCNEYQPKGDDASWLGSRGSYGLCVGGR